MTATTEPRKTEVEPAVQPADEATPLPPPTKRQKRSKSKKHARQEEVDAAIGPFSGHPTTMPEAVASELARQIVQMELEVSTTLAQQQQQQQQQQPASLPRTPLDQPKTAAVIGERPDGPSSIAPPSAVTTPDTVCEVGAARSKKSSTGKTATSSRVCAVAGNKRTAPAEAEQPAKRAKHSKKRTTEQQHTTPPPPPPSLPEPPTTAVEQPPPPPPPSTTVSISAPASIVGGNASSSGSPTSSPDTKPVAKSRASRNLPLATSSSITLLVRYVGEVSFARPTVLEWGPLPVTGGSGNNGPFKAAPPTPKNCEKFAYLRLAANHDIVIEPLKTQMVDMQFGLQFQGGKNNQHNQWTVHNWEPLMEAGVIVHHATPQVQNLRFLLQNAGSNTVTIKAGDPIAVVRFHPLPKKVNLVYVPLPGPAAVIDEDGMPSG